MVITIDDVQHMEVGKMLIISVSITLGVAQDTIKFTATDLKLDKSTLYGLRRILVRNSTRRGRSIVLMFTRQGVNFEITNKQFRQGNGNWLSFDFPQNFDIKFIDDDELRALFTASSAGDVGLFRIILEPNPQGGIN